jgi:predicted ATPase
MLTNLSVKHFKSWSSISRMRLAPITGLFGTNSSGKSSILQLLLMIKQTIESSDRAAVLEFGDVMGGPRDILFNHEIPGELFFSISWKRDRNLTIDDPLKKTSTLFSDKMMSFQSEINVDQSEKLSVKELAYDLGKNKFLMKKKGNGNSKYEINCDAGDFRFVRTPGRVWDLPAPVKCYGFPDQVYAYHQNAGFLAGLQLAFEELFQQVYYLGPLRDFPKRHYPWAGSEPADMGLRGERVVDAMLASRHRGKYLSPGPHKRRQTLEERIAFWLKELGLIHNFSVKAITEGSNLYQVQVRKSQFSADVLITDVGFGVSQILPIFVLCYYVPEGSTILLEQPEIHLHPSVQSGLADVFVDVVRNRNVQIIFESHSEHLLRRFQRRIADETLTSSETALYFCDLGAKSSTLTELDVNLFGDIQNWPKDFFGDEVGEMAAITRAAMQRKKAEQSS